MSLTRLSALIVILILLLSVFLLIFTCGFMGDFAYAAEIDDSDSGQYLYIFSINYDIKLLYTDGTVSTVYNAGDGNVKLSLNEVSSINFDDGYSGLMYGVTVSDTSFYAVKYSSIAISSSWECLAIKNDGDDVDFSVFDDDTAVSVETFSVTFYVNNVATEVTVESRQTVAEPTAPELEGYSFLYWHEKDTSAAFNFSTPITENIELYATFSRDNCIINYHNTMGDVIYTTSVNYGESFTAYAEYSSNYAWTELDYWATSITGETAYDFSDAATADIDLFAVEKTATVSIILVEEGSENISNDIEYGNTYNLGTCSKSGYTFVGWSDGNSIFNGSIVATTDLTLTATFEAIKYNISIQYDSGATAITDKTLATCGETVTISYILSTGNSLQSIAITYIDESGTTKDVSNNSGTFIMPSYDVSIIITTRLNIIYYSTGTSTYTFSYGEEIYIEAPSSTTATFKGWFLDATYTTPIPSNAYGEDGTVNIIYAKYESAYCTITYVTPAGTTLEATTIAYNDTYIPSTTAAPTYEGNQFQGWFFDEAYTVAASAIAVTTDITLYAKYTLATYTIYFYYGENNATVDIQEVEYLSTPTPPVVEDTEYTIFTKWDKDIVEATQSTVYLAIYTQLYTNVYYCEASLVLQTIGELTTTPTEEYTAINKEGYTWASFVVDNITDNTVTYKSIYEANSYSISIIEASGVTVIVSDTATYGTIVQFKVVLDAGYELITITSEQVEITENEFTMPASDVTIQCTAELYLVYYTTTGVQGSKYEFSYGEEIYIPAVNVDNFIFLGWFIDESCTIPLETIAYGEANSNTDVYPNLVLSAYTISYVVPEEVTSMEASILAYNDTFIPNEITAPTYEGYEFIGWYSDEEYNTIATAMIITEDTTLYAKYSEATYTIYFYYGENNDTVDIQEVAYLETPVSPTIEDSDYYVFESWDKEIVEATQSTVYLAIYTQLYLNIYYCGETELYRYIGETSIVPPADFVSCEHDDKTITSFICTGIVGNIISYEAVHTNNSFLITYEDSTGGQIQGALYAQYGETITIKTTISSGYELYSLASEEVTLTELEDAENYYSFIMPACDITIKILTTKVITSTTITDISSVTNCIITGTYTLSDMDITDAYLSITESEIADSQLLELQQTFGTTCILQEAISLDLYTTDYTVAEFPSSTNLSIKIPLSTTLDTQTYEYTVVKLSTTSYTICNSSVITDDTGTYLTFAATDGGQYAILATPIETDTIILTNFHTLLIITTTIFAVLAVTFILLYKKARTDIKYYKTNFLSH